MIQVRFRTGLAFGRIALGALLAVGTACAPATAPATPALATKPAAPPPPQTSPAPAGTAAPSPKPAGSPSPAAAAGPSAEAQRLAAAAKANNETELTLSWAEDNFGGIDGARQMEALMNRRHGLSIKITFTPGGSYDQTTARIAQEVAAGQKTFTDVHAGTATHFAPFVDKNVMESYDYALLSPRVPRTLIAPGNIAVEVATRIPMLAYNTNLVQPNEVPKKLEDVLNPKWKGKVAVTPTAAELDIVARRPEWGPEKFKAFTEKLAEQAGGLIRGGELERIASGEFTLLVLANAGHDITALKAKGAPVGGTIPEDVALLGLYLLGIPRTSAHPNLAKLYIETVLSEDGQRFLYQTQLIDHAELPGSQSAAAVNEVRSRGATFLKVNVPFLTQYTDQAKLKDDLIAILRSKLPS